MYKPGAGFRRSALIRLICLLVAACWGFLLPGCQKHEPVRIGFIGGMSGRSADLGVAGRNGAMLAIEQRNAAGGINGRAIELVVRDDGQNQEQARKAIAELLAMRLELIIGPMTSSVTEAVLPQINNSPAVLLSPTVTTTELTGKDDQFLRIIADTSTYAAKSARFQYATLNHRRIAAIYDLGNRSYTTSWLNNFKRVFEQHGGKMVLIKPFTSGVDTVFYDSVKQLLAQKPDSILIVANAVDAALICQQIRKSSKDLPIVTSEWASTERFIELAGAAAERVHIAQFVDRNNQSGHYLAFVRAYKERFGGQEPGFAGMAGYDAALVAIKAFEQRGNSSLKEAIIKIGSFEGAQQKITVDRFGDANRNNFITEVQQGHFVTLE